ncbi:MAG: N-6 DNA methylase [Brevinema sp.]
MNELQIVRDKGLIYSPIRKKYIVETPEETVRQEFVCILVNEYGYKLEQMQEEVNTTGRASAQARADLVIYQNISDIKEKNTPLIIVECKADTVTITDKDYLQGELYARQCGAPFFVTHNNLETRYWRVKKDKMPGYREQISNIPQATDTQDQINDLLQSLLVFKENEFADLLHRCHNIIRNTEKLDPAAAFDEIAKILFMKVYVERDLLKGKRAKIMTKDWVEQSKEFTNNILEKTFNDTKRLFAKDQIFEKDERIRLKEHTIIRIIQELEAYNLSMTSTDVKGIAFEKFLGRTFRGEIGQFFTPRPIVEFMVDMINPQESEISCDPSSGSGGFLIRIFGKVRDLIQASIQKEYDDYYKQVIGEKSEEKITEEEAKLLSQKMDELKKDLLIDPNVKGSRLWKLSNQSIYGVDANDRMARTSKMNMIMHGDGHGGIHHHDGLLNVNGIFEGRFDIILTNPPFGAKVDESDLIEASQTILRYNNKGEIEAVEGKEDIVKDYFKRYGEQKYIEAQHQVLNNIGKPIASIFDLVKDKNSDSEKTEHLFVNRCLDLMKDGGRMGIVLPEGVFNNPNAEYVRSFTEDRAFIRAVISLPQDTFLSSGASVKCSILFVQKYTEDQKKQWLNIKENALKNCQKAHQQKIDELQAIIDYKKSKDEDTIKFTASDKKKARDESKNLMSMIESEAKALAREQWDYPIFMAEPESVGITSTGETGANVPNDLQDVIEKDENDNDIVKEKGIVTYFREFLEEHHISWGSING